MVGPSVGNMWQAVDEAFLGNLGKPASSFRGMLKCFQTSFWPYALRAEDGDEYPRRPHITFRRTSGLFLRFPHFQVFDVPRNTFREIRPPLLASGHQAAKDHL